MGKGITLHLNALLFAVLALALLPVMNSDLLYTWQEYNLFLKGRMFMSETLASGGLWAWVGCYLTQFFYYPWLGSAMLIAIWVATYYLLADAFKAKGVGACVALLPVVCLLISVVDVGYWIYYIKSSGYCFSYSVLCLTASLITWCASRMLVHITEKRSVWCNVALAVFFPVVLFLIGYRVPEFAHGEYTDTSLQIPFIIAAFAPLLLVVPFREMKSRWQGVALSVGAGAVLSGVAVMRNVSDSNFHSEMKMYRALDELRYEDVVAEAEGWQDAPTNLMVLYKNIALLHLGRMTEMFATNSCGVQPNADEAMNLRIVQMGGDMAYFQLGQMNFAFRWAMENGVKRGMTVARLKMMARCAIFTQQFDVAHKYLVLLRQTNFHRKWAKEREQWIVHGPTFIDSKECATISPLLNDADNELDMSEDGLAEQWLLQHYATTARPASQKLMEMILCSALWTQNEQSFIDNIDIYLKHNRFQSIPQLYQEAMILLANSGKMPQSLANIPLDVNVSERYNSFANDYQSLANQGMEAKQIGERMKSLYGNTYWWYYYFYSDFVIY